jgi:hypothetical protein
LGLFFFLVVSLMMLLPAHQLYGSTILCDPSNQTNCNGQRSVYNSGTEVTDNLQPDNTETPIIIPDISPTDEDLSDTATSDDLDGTDTEVTNNDNDNDNTYDNSENNIDGNFDGNEDSDSDDEPDDNNNNDQPSQIPFP